MISLFGFPTGAPGTGSGGGHPPGTWVTVDGIVHLLSEHAGRHLLVLAERFELVWCSGWEEKANEYLPAAVGLPGPLPYLTFGPDGGGQGPDAVEPRSDGAGRPPDGALRHWKLDAVDAWAGAERALAWLDDAFDEGCRAWAARRPGPTLLVPTEPARGLTEHERDVLMDWAGAAAQR